MARDGSGSGMPDTYQHGVSDGLNESKKRIAELEKKLAEANEISRMRFDRMEELSDALVEESDKYEAQLAAKDAQLKIAREALWKIQQRAPKGTTEYALATEALKQMGGGE